jgi:SAM-dependent methyltransferase
MARTLLRRSPWIESAIRTLYFAAKFHPVSHGDFARVSEQLSGTWMDDRIPAPQRAVVEPRLASYRAGKPDPAFDALVDILSHNIPRLENKGLLEIGCSSGYYSEVLRSRGVAVSYQGCDFAPAFIRLARQIYPRIRFDVEDATRLSYGASSFDIAVSACCLLHIAEYERAISEAARVSREFVVFHSTPVLHMTGPSSYTKKAYGVDMLEIHFNEQQLVRMVAAQGLRVVDVCSYLSSAEKVRTEPLFYKTYLCQKAR